MCKSHASADGLARLLHEAVIGHFKRRQTQLTLKTNIMTVAEFLKKTEVDVTTNKCPLGNQLKADLSHQKVFIDFNTEVKELTDEEKYQIGRSLILMHIKGRPFLKDELISKMDNLIEEETQNTEQ